MLNIEESVEELNGTVKLWQVKGCEFAVVKNPENLGEIALIFKPDLSKLKNSLEAYLRESGDAVDLGGTL